ncbi:MAG: RNA polymerase subunit sigma, partial [Myxococcales bacterium]|nr:RNA polymerase subunit sigma [Myxococcales bacterium]
MKLDDAMGDPAIYSHLRELAARIHGERGGPETLRPTALVNEAWMKVQRHGGEFSDRAHFIAVACRAMRQILVDHARQRRADKRGGALRRTTVEGVGISSEPVDFLALDAALDELARA